MYMRWFVPLIRIEKCAIGSPTQNSRHSDPHKLLALKTLRVKQRREVAIVDPRGSGGCDRGLGVEGNAQSCLTDHAEIVGAVADSQRVDIVEVRVLAKLNQRGELGGAAQNRLLDLAG